MNAAAVRANRRKLLILAAIVLLCVAGYMLVDVNFSNPKLLAYAMKIRTPKLIVMLITAFSIGGASLVFQSIINNTIVTPCLLGMNSLYTLIHTAVVFFLLFISIILYLAVRRRTKDAEEPEHVSRRWHRGPKRGRRR